ncbi:MAG: hypothetical protein H6732_04720 [Alphaproteobacteria bacterium]|nr:hypothetical protein [Alphaproteobacteria bacterium]
MTLAAILDDPSQRARFVQDGVRLIESEVSSKGGLTGLALKAGFRAVQGLRPGMVAELLDMLLPHFAPALEPHVAQAVGSGDVPAWFSAHADQLADAMLAVTDARADRAQNALLRRTYQSLRGQARVHTVQAMPAAGRLLAPYLT